VSAPALTTRETSLVGECLVCVAAGDVIADDWEFTTLFGISSADFRVVSGSWPQVNFQDEKVVLAVHNALGNLLGYPHGHNEIWGARISATRDEVAKLFEKVRGDRLTNPSVTKGTECDA
jgi:hypothetical protein